MKREGLIINGKRYVTTREAAKTAGYAPDYVGQLCRAGKLDCTTVGRSWFVAQESLLAHKKTTEQKLRELHAVPPLPTQPLLPKEAKKTFLPVPFPRQLLMDIAGIAAIFMLSLGFAWSFESGASTRMVAGTSDALSSFSKIVAPELPSIKSEATSAVEIIADVVTMPGKLVIGSYQNFLESASRGADLLGGTVLNFSYNQFVLAGHELGGITTALMELHLSVIENAGPLLLGFSNTLLDGAFYAVNEAGKGLALVTDALLSGHMIAVETLGTTLTSVGEGVTDGYMVAIEHTGGVLATISGGLLESYDRGLVMIGNTLAEAAASSTDFALVIARDGVGSLLALHATLIDRAGEGLSIVAHVPLVVSESLIQRSGDVVSTVAFVTMDSYTTLVSAAGSGLASISSGILDGYSSSIAFLAGKTGTAIEPTVTRMAVIFSAGVEVAQDGAQKYLGALASALPRTEQIVEVESYSDENIFLVKHAVPEDYFDEFDALSLDAAMAAHELSSGVADVLYKAEVVSMQATLSIDNYGYAAVGASKNSLEPLRLAAQSFYRTVFGFKMAVSRSFDGLFTLIPEQVSQQQSRGAEGVVVVPSAGAEADAEARARIQSIFSDAVEVRPDASGAAGVIVPQFKHRSSEDFLYVLVPINE